MISLKLRTSVDQILLGYCEKGIKSFYASDVAKDLLAIGIDYNGMEIDLVQLLQEMVDEGTLERRFKGLLTYFVFCFQKKN